MASVHTLLTPLRLATESGRRWLQSGCARLRRLPNSNWSSCCDTSISLVACQVAPSVVSMVSLCDSLPPITARQVDAIPDGSFQRYIKRGAPWAQTAWEIICRIGPGSTGAIQCLSPTTHECKQPAQKPGPATFTQPDRGNERPQLMPESGFLFAPSTCTNCCCNMQHTPTYMQVGDSVVMVYSSSAWLHE